MPEFQPRQNLTDLTVETIMTADVDSVAFAMAQTLSAEQLRNAITQFQEQLTILEQDGATTEETSGTRANLHSAHAALQLQYDFNNFGL